jgi:transposase
MPRLTLLQKQQIFDRKGDPISKLINEFGVSASTICLYQKKRAIDKRKITKKSDPVNDRKDKPQSLYDPDINIILENIPQQSRTIGKVTTTTKHVGLKLTIQTELRPLSGVDYEQLRQNVNLILEPFIKNKAIK